MSKYYCLNTLYTIIDIGEKDMGLLDKLLGKKKTTSVDSDIEIIEKARYMSLEEITQESVQRVLLSRAEELCPRQSVDTNDPSVKIIRYSQITMPKDPNEEESEDFFIAVRVVDGN